MNIDLLSYQSIDDLLGDRAGRFFGEGYKKITHQIFEVLLGTDAQGRARLTATGAVRYPMDWSQKSSRVLVPHLSSIDASIFSCRLLEVLLREVCGLTESEISLAWLPYVQFSSGTVATESLDEFTMTATVVSIDGSTVRLEGQIGSAMSLEATVALPVAARPQPITAGPVLCAGQGYFHDAVYRRSQYLRNVVVTSHDNRAAADFELTDFENGARDGFAEAYQPSVSLIDATVILAQLSQVVLYDLDNIARKDSETLWMRRLTARTTTPPARYLPGQAATHLARSMVLTFGGGNWRISNWEANFAGYDVRYDLAHRLPS